VSYYSTNIFSKSRMTLFLYDLFLYKHWNTLSN
jgi:hypothetical protein